MFDGCTQLINKTMVFHGNEDAHCSSGFVMTKSSDLPYYLDKVHPMELRLCVMALILLGKLVCVQRLPHQDTINISMQSWRS